MTEVFFETPVAGVDADWFSAIAQLVVQGELAEDPGNFTLVFVDNAAIQKLNKEYLHKDRPTDVIAFNLDDEADHTWGEIYISAERAAEQAEEYAVSLYNELARLTIHGTLHLAGFEDTSPEDRKLMTAREDYYLQQCFDESLLPVSSEDS